MTFGILVRDMSCTGSRSLADRDTPCTYIYVEPLYCGYEAEKKLITFLEPFAALWITPTTFMKQTAIDELWIHGIHGDY